MIDKKSVIIGCFAGIILGFILSFFLVMYGIQEIGTAFTIQNMNVTLDINETAIIEAQKQMYEAGMIP